jgi:3'-phosphoadenosine 5'-phosphosulfate sulfotransferase (PAPS reductase)/FAD synthetase
MRIFVSDSSMPQFLLSASYGNDSIALIQWAHENDLSGVHVVYCDTGWAADWWPSRVEQGEELARGYGFSVHQVSAYPKFDDLMRMKRGFPSNMNQWCSAFLKAVPLNDIEDRIDPACTMTVMIGKRRAESVSRANTPEFIDSSEYHGGRRVWHPLYLHTDEQRNELIRRSGMPLLPHRSLECDPCVNANKGDIRRLSAERINRVEALEKEVGNTFFKPSAHGGAVGIREVHKWACSGRGKYVPGQDDVFGDQGCGSPFGCGL